MVMKLREMKEERDHLVIHLAAELWHHYFPEGSLVGYGYEEKGEIGF